MKRVVLRVRLISGDHLDVTLDGPASDTEEQAIEHAVSALAHDTGVLRARHGDRPVVLYGRGVAAIEALHREAWIR